VEYIEREYDEQKPELAEVKSIMATSENVLELKQKIVERGNYSRRNNILIQNIPEGVDYKEFVKCFLEEQFDKT